MHQEEKELIISRICSGILRLKVNSHTILVKSPEAEHRYKANEIYRETLLDCLESGLYSESELLDFIMEKGYWSHQDETQLEELKKNIDDFKVGLFHAMRRSNSRRTIKKAIETANKAVESLIKRRYSYNNLSAAATASMAKTKYLLASCSFFEDDSPVINIKNYWSCNNDLIDMIIHKYNEEQLDDSDFRELSRYDGWRLIWACKKSTPNIFPQKNAVDLTMEQKRLIYWTAVYDGAYESMDCPTDDVFEDDDAFDGWLIIQNRKRKQDRQKTSIEDSISEKLAGCDEVFVPAETIEDAKKIFEMNDEVARSTQKIREKVISEKGVVNELDLPDVRRKLIMAVNQKINKTISGA